MLEYPDNSSTAPVAQGGRVNMPAAKCHWKCLLFFKISLTLLHRLLTMTLRRADEESHWGQKRGKGAFSKFSIYPSFHGSQGPLTSLANIFVRNQDSASMTDENIMI